jgi:hypothetical protein
MGSNKYISRPKIVRQVTTEMQGINRTKEWTNKGLLLFV